MVVIVSSIMDIFKTIYNNISLFIITMPSWLHVTGYPTPLRTLIQVFFLL